MTLDTTTDPRFRNPLEGFTPSGTHWLDQVEVRRRIGDWYRLHEGMRSKGPEEDAYEAMILPNDEPTWRHRYADEAWSCALRFRAVLYYLGVEHPLVTCPYATRIGLAVADVASVARHYGALVDGKALESYEPDAGDAMCSGAGAAVHVSCVVSATWEPGPGLTKQLRVICSDGGQGSQGQMAINENQYVWTAGTIRSVNRPKFAPDRPGPRRPLVWVINISQLLLSAGALSDRT